MRIGVNTLFIQPGRNRGTEYYLRGLLPELAKLAELVLFTSRQNHESFEGIGLERIQLPVSGHRRVTRILYEQLMLSRAAERAGCNLLFCPGYLAPLIGRLPQVVAIYDCQFLDIPHAIPQAQRLSYRLLVPPGARAAAAVVTISEFSRGRICEAIGVPQQKVFLTYPGATPPHQNHSAMSTTPPFFLCASGGSPHKNLPRLLEAFQLFRLNSQSPYELILVGSRADELRALNVPLSGIPGVKWLGFVPRSTLDELYRAASAVIVPSTYEGFGLPVVEAMSWGAPVICSNAACLPEVCGDAALLVDPLSIAAMAESMQQIATEPKLAADLRERGFRNIARFSWQRCAEETMRAFEYASRAAR